MLYQVEIVIESALK